MTMFVKPDKPKGTGRRQPAKKSKNQKKNVPTPLKTVESGDKCAAVRPEGGRVPPATITSADLREEPVL